MGTGKKQRSRKGERLLPSNQLNACKMLGGGVEVL